MSKTGLLTEKVRKDLILLRQQNTLENEGVWRYIKNMCGSRTKRKLIYVNLLLVNYCYATGQTIFWCKEYREIKRRKIM